MARARCPGLFRRKPHPFVPATVCIAPEHLLGAVAREARGKVRAVMLVDNKTCKAGIFFDEHKFAGCEVQRVQVEELWVTAVHTHKDAIADGSAHPLDRYRNVFERRQVAAGASIQIDYMNMEV